MPSLPKKIKPPSDMFVDAVSHSGSCEEVCELCGRTCYEDDEFSHDDGRLEELKRLSQKEPSKYVEVDQVRWGDLDGKHVVTTCPCRGLRAYEDFIWGHRSLIASYVQKRAEQVAEAAYKDEAEAEFLQENLATEDLNRTFAKCQGSGCGGYFDSNLLSPQGFCSRCGEEAMEQMKIEEQIRRDREDDDISPF